MKKCLLCSSSPRSSLGDLFCQKCYVHLKSSMLPRNQVPSCFGNLKVLSILKYTGAVPGLIQKIKRSPCGLMDVELETFVKEIFLYFLNGVSICEFDYVVHVPSNPLRVCWETDFSFWLAQKIAQRFDKKHLSSVLYRNYWHPQSYISQKSLSREMRGDMKRSHVFSVRQDYRDLLRNKKLLLVDDVVSSGSSLNFSALKLRELGAQCFFAFSFAHS